MDNQFDNGFYGDVPQRPFTEKNEPEVPVQPVTGFQPEKPLMQKEQPAWQQPAQPVYPQQPQQPVYPPQNPQPNYAPYKQPCSRGSCYEDKYDYPDFEVHIPVLTVYPIPHIFH